jgi:hypothetical protein
VDPLEGAGQLQALLDECLVDPVGRPPGQLASQALLDVEAGREGCAVASHHQAAQPAPLPSEAPRSASSSRICELMQLCLAGRSSVRVPTCSSLSNWIVSYIAPPPVRASKSSNPTRPGWLCHGGSGDLVLGAKRRDDTEHW